MGGRFIALLISGALALAVSSGSVLAAGDDKEQSKLPSSPPILVVPGKLQRARTSQSLQRHLLRLQSLLRPQRRRTTNSLRPTALNSTV